MNSKRKGSAGERELCGLLQGAGFTEAHRNNQQYIGGLENPDISTPGLHWEVKRTERFNAYEAMEQAEKDANGKKTPIVAHRRNRKPWLVVMKLEDWLTILRSTQGPERQEGIQAGRKMGAKLMK